MCTDNIEICQVQIAHSLNDIESTNYEQGEDENRYLL